MEMPGYRLDDRALLFRTGLPCPAEILKKRMSLVIGYVHLSTLELHAFCCAKKGIPLLLQYINKDIPLFCGSFRKKIYLYKYGRYNLMCHSYTTIREVCVIPISQGHAFNQDHTL